MSLQIILFFAFVFKVNFGEFELIPVIQLFCIGFGLLGVLLIIIALLQLQDSISPFPTPSKNASLITSAIFKHIRHPIYTGIILILFSTGFYLGSVYKISIALLVFVLLHFKAIYEEELLLDRFSEYHLYMKKTGRFFPKL